MRLPCAPWHNGADAPNAEALMRSRYSAYVLRLEPYLLATWHHSTRPQQLEFDDEFTHKWLGLKVKRYILSSPNTAIVEFYARYRTIEHVHKLHEISHFVREENRWYYLYGDITSD